jgi:LasA protease
VVAVGNGPVVRIGNGIVVQDLDEESSLHGDALSKSDNKEQTGWAIFYMHIASRERVEQGTYLQAGQRIGHPSCEGGPATGTHLHIARKYNGEWIAAAGSLPFVMDGWTVQGGQNPYEGKLFKGDQIVIANPYASFFTHITRPQADPTASPTTPAGVK